MGKLDLKVLRAAYHKAAPFPLGNDFGRLLDECQRLQKREAAVAKLIALPGSVLRGLRTDPNAYSDATVALLNEIERLAAEVLAEHARRADGSGNNT